MPFGLVGSATCAYGGKLITSWMVRSCDHGDVNKAVDTLASLDFIKSCCSTRRKGSKRRISGFVPFSGYQHDSDTFFTSII